MPITLRSRAQRRLLPVVAGGVLAGAIDLGFACLYNGAHGVSPTRILQTIASGLLGPAAFEHPLPAAPIGFAAHFLILIGAAAVYAAIGPRLRWTDRHAYLAGMLFGAGIYATMHLVVLPLSNAPHFRWNPQAFAADFSVHVLLLGPAIAWVDSRLRRFG